MIRQAVHLDKIRLSKFGKWNVYINEINMYMLFFNLWYLCSRLSIYLIKINIYLNVCLPYKQTSIQKLNSSLEYRNGHLLKYALNDNE